MVLSVFLFFLLFFGVFTIYKNVYPEYTLLTDEAGKRLNVGRIAPIFVRISEKGALLCKIDMMHP